MMADSVQNSGLADKIANELPYLRRYARALTGSQTSGDAYALATLEAILADPQILKRDWPVRVALYGSFHTIWKSSGAPVEGEESGLLARAQALLGNLTENTREALLLNTIEDFDTAQIAKIMGLDTTEVDHLLEVAHDEMSNAVTGRVMIIEDEAIIAVDLASIVTSSGHTVVGVARTRDEAEAMGSAEEPDLILADIQLADNSSGIDAVNTLMTDIGERPVIFITAFPERLLTGDRPEPAFMISKPYSEQQVQSAISQAMFFASTETLAT